MDQETLADFLNRGREAQEACDRILGLPPRIHISLTPEQAEGIKALLDYAEADLIDDPLAFKEYITLDQGVVEEALSAFRYALKSAKEKTVAHPD